MLPQFNTLRRALAACVAAATLTCCSPTPAANPPLIVSADPEAQPDPAEKPAVARKLQTFESFLREFQDDYSESPQRVERHISSRLGIFLLLNPGAFQRATFHTSFRELLVQADDWAKLPTQLNCGAPAQPWVKSDGGFPKYDCELERYYPDESCTSGTLTSGELREVIALSGEYDLETPERVADLMQHAAALEPRITHYAFDAAHHLGLMFGEVDGVWRLLYVRKISPCSA